MGGGFGDLFLLEDFLVGVFCLVCLCGGDFEGFCLVEWVCGWVFGEVDGLGDCLEVWDLGLIFGLGEDECECFEFCNLGVLVGGGEVDVECLVLWIGEVDVVCVDFWFLGL